MQSALLRAARSLFLPRWVLPSMARPRLGFAALTVLLAVGCYRTATVRRQAARIEATPTVRGNVSVDGGLRRGAAIVVVVMRPPRAEHLPAEVVDLRQLYAEGPFAFRVAPRPHWIGAWLDEDDDLELDPGERFTGPVPFDAREHANPRLRIGAEVVTEATASPLVTDARALRVGDVVPLSEPRFGSANAQFGIWQPVRWLARHRGGLFFDEPYDPARTPVLFVHGIGGWPQQFVAMAEELDRARFQVWVVHYPSGFPVGMVGAWLARVLSETRSRFAHRPVCLVAHSMGGLVAREALNVQAENDPRRSVARLVTLASPFDGVPFAATGVRLSPGVVPAWRDLSPGSPFLRDLFRGGEMRIPHDLIFAFHEDAGDDQVVAIRSQLRAEAQAGAESIRGFEATHAGVLEHADAIAHVHTALDRCHEAGSVPVVEHE